MSRLETIKETQAQCDQCHQEFVINTDGTHRSWQDSDKKTELCFCCSLKSNEAYEKCFVPHASMFLQHYRACNHQKDHEPFSVQDWRRDILYCQPCNMLKAIMLWYTDELIEQHRQCSNSKN